MTSSKMSTLSWASVISRSPSRKPGRGGTTPMLPATGSTMTGAVSRPRSPKSARPASGWVDGAGCAGVGRGGERQRGERPGDAGAIRDGERRASGAGLHQEAVGVAVIAAVELHEVRAGGGAARQAD